MVSAYLTPNSHYIAAVTGPPLRLSRADHFLSLFSRVHSNTSAETWRVIYPRSGTSAAGHPFPPSLPPSDSTYQLPTRHPSHRHYCQNPCPRYTIFTPPRSRPCATDIFCSDCQVFEATPVCTHPRLLINPLISLPY